MPEARLRRFPPYGKDRAFPGVICASFPPERCHSSAVEHFIGNEEVDSSILSGSTIFGRHSSNGHN
jgi:hypothetical protein